MTDERPVEHDVDACFTEEDCGAVDGFTSTAEPGGLLVSGRCPRCGAPTSFTFEIGTPGAAGGPAFWHPRRVAAPPVPEMATVFCACGYPHTGRPGDSPERGCGAYWKVTIS